MPQRNIRTSRDTRQESDGQSSQAGGSMSRREFTRAPGVPETPPPTLAHEIAEKGVPGVFGTPGSRGETSSEPGKIPRNEYERINKPPSRTIHAKVKNLVPICCKDISGTDPQALRDAYQKAYNLLEPLEKKKYQLERQEWRQIWKQEAAHQLSPAEGITVPNSSNRDSDTTSRADTERKRTNPMVYRPDSNPQKVSLGTDARTEASPFSRVDL